MNKTKKSQAIFSIVMLLVFIPLLFTAIIRMDKAESRTETIGETVLEVKKINEKAEKALFYLEQSGRYSAHAIVNEIKGNISVCNESYEKNIAKLLEQKLEEYLSNYNDKSVEFLTRDNYGVTIINNGTILLANAKSDLSINFNKGAHSFNPSFSVPFGYDVHELCS